MTIDDLSLPEARRMALAAQGFERPRPIGRVDVRHIRSVIHKLGLLQIDYVNVVVPAHYQVLFSRLGPYDRSRLDDLVYRRREFTEQWAHEASIIPMATWPLLRHRMDTYRVRPWGFEKFMDKHTDYVKSVLDEIRRRGPLSAEDLKGPGGRTRKITSVLDHDENEDSFSAWMGTVPRATLEAHFGRGRLAVSRRRSNLARVFDLVGRVIPEEHLHRRVPRDAAQRELIRLAAGAHGVATAGDLADYYRMPIRDARKRLDELVEAGEIRRVRVEGWNENAYRHRAAGCPRRIEGASLLSPFDPLIWTRARVARLFEFDYRIEIFVPQAKRKWGYYVMPFRQGDRLVARVDLKADRDRGRLLVLAAYLEPGEEGVPVAKMLARELGMMSVWLGLGSVLAGRRGGFIRTLKRALADTPPAA